MKAWWTSAALLALLGTPSAQAVDAGWEQVEVGHLIARPNDAAQDEDGFLWFASPVGLVRFDGERTVLVEPVGRHLTSDKVVVAAGEVFTTTRAGTTYRVEGEHLVPVAGPDGAPLQTRAMEGTPGGLWSWSEAHGLLLRDPDGRWSEHTPPDLPEQTWVYHLRPDGDGVLVASYHGLFEVRPGSAARRWSSAQTVDAARLADGRLAAYSDGVYILDDSGSSRIFEHPDRRLVWMLERNGVLLLGFDVAMYRLTLDGRAAVYRRYEYGGAPSNREGMVARDGSLWIGSARLIEPDILVYGTNDGVTPSGRWITVGPDDRVFYSSWRRFAELEPGGPRPPHPLQDVRILMVCPTREGRPLAASSNGEIRDLDTTEVLTELPRATDCTRTDDGTIWFAGSGAVVEIMDDRVLHHPAPEQTHRAIVLTDDGTVVTVGGTWACEARLEAVRAHADDAWTCTDLGEAVGPNIAAAVQVAPGVVWAATEGDGLYERTAPGTWAPAPVDLPVRSVNRLQVEGDDVWVDQVGAMVRLARQDGAWVVRERVGIETGLPALAVDVDEDEHGNLWLATGIGAGFVPAARRRIDPQPFPPRLVRALVDGEPAQEPLRVPSGGSAELQFAALAYSFPHSLRYRWRIGDGAWSTPSRSGTIRLAGLAVGDQDVEVSTRVEGGAWSEPVRVALVVVPAWWERPWIWLGLVVGLAGIALWIQRLRSRVAVETERQRAQIAMDLHDELGAGLGSISILSGLLTREGLPAESTREAARRISVTADELGGSVTDMVWSLRSRSHDVRALVAYARDRAQGFLDPERVRLRVDLPPELPRVQLTPPVARAAQLILVEALYNVARHADASEVVIRVRRKGERWQISVRDNGVGLHQGPDTRTGGGTGLQSMRERARAVGAEVTLASTPGEPGTDLSLLLPR